MKVIVLAAGQGYQLDGFNKLLIRDPRDGKSVIEKYQEAFPNLKIEVVLGYKAINVMNLYPHFNYFYNPKWATTNNSYSLSIALDDTPCIVLSGDLLFDKYMGEKILSAPDNCVFTQNRDSREMNSLNVKLTDNNNIEELYQGPLKDQCDPESVGIFKISDKKILKEWKRNCKLHSNLFAGLNLPLNVGITGQSINAYSLDQDTIYEVNTPLDYIRLLDIYKKSIKKNRVEGD